MNSLSGGFVPCDKSAKIKRKTVLSWLFCPRLLPAASYVFLMAAILLGFLENKCCEKTGEAADQPNCVACYLCRLSFTRTVVKDLMVKEVEMSALDEVLESQTTR